MFYEACAKSDECALHESTPSQVQARLENILEKLRQEPVPVPSAGSPHDYGLVDYSMAKALIFGWTYAPYQTASLLASAFAALEKGNGTLVYGVMRGYMLSCDCSKPPRKPAPLASEHTLAIACGDAIAVDENIEELQSHYERMAQFSTFADVWSIHLQCSSV
jgi:hypothetical protein